jgi:hypothetical protein
MKIDPNPFKISTTITFSLPHRSFVHLAIIDAQGRILAKNYSGNLQKGTHTMVFTADAHIPAGTYFAQLQCCGKRFVQKITRLR